MLTGDSYDMAGRQLADKRAGRRSSKRDTRLPRLPDHLQQGRRPSSTGSLRRSSLEDYAPPNAGPSGLDGANYFSNNTTIAGGRMGISIERSKIGSSVSRVGCNNFSDGGRIGIKISDTWLGSDSDGRDKYNKLIHDSNAHSQALAKLKSVLEGQESDQRPERACRAAFTPPSPEGRAYYEGFAAAMGDVLATARMTVPGNVPLTDSQLTTVVGLAADLTPEPISHLLLTGLGVVAQSVGTKNRERTLANTLRLFRTEQRLQNILNAAFEQTYETNEQKIINYCESESNEILQGAVEIMGNFVSPRVVPRPTPIKESLVNLLMRSIHKEDTSPPKTHYLNDTEIGRKVLTDIDVVMRVVGGLKKNEMDILLKNDENLTAWMKNRFIENFK
ncbi:hypothetical protein GWC77_26830 [Paraburkholderia sp. NMBU_R16]|uniref:hypothetical protein n=1 Tax=Paraburkholderia sp. NMBU_R16 TaxID=2698676 RepID=UPI0015652DD8|nr:hypothetical protein [Paraburkholderia sp. NMBU_R16]NRO99492.1 hypothetical protein [Paraburkholderia sp. NMBU_R16]